MRTTLLTFCVLVGASVAALAEERKRPSEAILDNSFLIEEAYNQEPGVVQHIFNLSFGLDKRHGADDREWLFAFTQEWPLWSQTHQFSYTIPYTWLKSEGERTDGFGDILINYRLQAILETASRPAFAPRLSLILPTGSLRKGTGNGEWGFETNLPFSKVLNDRWSAHFNAGLTCYPDVRGESLTTYRLGGSLIYAVNDRFNLMLEAVGAWEEDLGEAGGTDRDFSAVISPGFRYAFDLPRDMQVVVGLAAPIGMTRAAPDYGVFLYFSLEHPFVRTAEAPVSKK